MPATSRRWSYRSRKRRRRFAAYNGVLAIPGLGVYATDSGAGWVVRLSESSGGELSAEIVARAIPIANGLAYDAAQRTLYVASSLGMAVFSFSVAADGTLSNRVRSRRRLARSSTVSRSTSKAASTRRTTTVGRCFDSRTRCRSPS